jgi:hypothetical protein
MWRLHEQAVAGNSKKIIIVIIVIIIVKLFIINALKHP